MVQCSGGFMLHVGYILWSSLIVMTNENKHSSTISWCWRHVPFIWTLTINYQPFILLIYVSTLFPWYIFKNLLSLIYVQLCWPEHKESIWKTLFISYVLKSTLIPRTNTLPKTNTMYKVIQLEASNLSQRYSGVMVLGYMLVNFCDCQL